MTELVEDWTIDLLNCGKMLLAGRDVMGVHCFYWVGLFTSVFLTFRYVSFWLIDGISRRTVRDPRWNSVSGQPLNPEDEKLRSSWELLVGKFKKYIVHLWAYVFMMSFGGYFLSFAPWCGFFSWEFEHLSIGWPHSSDALNDKINRGGIMTGFNLVSKTPFSFLSNEWGLISQIHLFQMVQMSWYLAGSVENIIHDRSRGDFRMMLLHHFLTVFLIYGSFCCDAHRVGLHVTVTLDVADICMYYCKAYHLSTSDFSGNANRGYTGRHTAHLSVLTIVWYITRVYVYGLEIKAMWDHNHFASTPFIGNYLKVFLALLWVLQAVWALALLKMTISQAREGGFKDNLSGDFENVKAKGVKSSVVKSTILLDASATDATLTGSSAPSSGTSTPTTQLEQVSEEEGPDEVPLRKRTAFNS